MILHMHGANDSQKDPCSQFSLPALWRSMRKPSLKRGGNEKNIARKFNIHVEILFYEGDLLSNAEIRICTSDTKRVGYI